MLLQWIYSVKRRILMSHKDLACLSQLLDTLKPLISKSDAAQFNILDILQVSSREVAICRLLAALLDPNGMHGLGIFPAQQFLDQILGQVCPEGALDSTYLKLEDYTDTNRRVDIALVIESRKQVYPIEVKIWAADQDRQVCDYYHYYENLGWELPAGICYLTPFGSHPSLKSAGDLEKSQIRLLSFQHDITRWLDLIIQKAAEQQNFRTADTARQFQEVIWSMTSTNDEEVIKVLFPEENPTKNLHVLNYLYQNQDSILRNFQLRYLQTALLPLPDGIEIRPADSQKDPRRILDVLRNGQLIAGIYIETNLYLQAEESYMILDADPLSTGNTPSRWRYLYRYSSKSPICLKYPWKNNPPLSEQRDDRICNLKSLCDSIVPIQNCTLSFVSESGMQY